MAERLKRIFKIRRRAKVRDGSRSILKWFGARRRPDRVVIHLTVGGNTTIIGAPHG